jgi:hypothetical protein
LASLADLVRAMNCYYSNLIEGHDTHPIDIERALKSDYSNDAKKRDLQLEAQAHIAVQKWIDAGGLKRPCCRRRLCTRDSPAVLRGPTGRPLVGRRPRDVNITAARKIKR